MSAAETVLLLLVVSFGLLSEGFAGCPDVVTRRRWGARSPVTVEYLTIPLKYVVVGHTVTPTCSSQASCARVVASIQQQHIQRAYDDISYGFLIGGNGLIFEGRGWHKQGAHTFGYNKRSIGVAFIGDFDENPAPESLIQALRDLLACGKEQGELSEDVKLIGLRQVAATVSPGLALYQQLQDLPEWLENPPN